ncbi:hypothetical protein PLCT2_02486 [Planctomycetaceae bacterium]|nr:hypothetical protein PLCT2_02486 [Planctomycetaceae bacterium]
MEPCAETAYLFRHALMRDAAYQLQLPGDRAMLHVPAFSILEPIHGALASNAESALELAYHASVGAIQDPDLALAEKHWLTKAAALSEQQSAHDTARRSGCGSVSLQGSLPLKPLRQH